jgi:predicted nucleic acid-binding protein
MPSSPKVFLDTNILVYQFDAREPVKQNRSIALFDQALTEIDTCISNQVVQEFINVILKKFSDKVKRHDLDGIINQVLWPLCAHVPGVDFYQRTLTLHTTHSLNWYDALIVQAAIDLNCDILYSEDLPDGQRFGALTIRNPFTD